MPADWYRNKDEQAHVTETDWKYVDVTTRTGKVRQMKMGSQLERKKSKNIANWWMSLVTPLLGHIISLGGSLERWWSIPIL